MISDQKHLFIHLVHAHHFVVRVYDVLSVSDFSLITTLDHSCKCFNR